MSEERLTNFDKKIKRIDPTCTFCEALDFKYPCFFHSIEFELKMIKDNNRCPKKD